MIPKILYDCITRSGHSHDGCGMSTRPDYYSGRGVREGDLSAESLVRMYTCIKAHPGDFGPEGDKAADAFCRMVRDTKVLTATDFLLNLHRLAGCGFRWTDGVVEGNGVDFPRDDQPNARFAVGMATLFESMNRSPAHDSMMSMMIKNTFFAKIGRFDLRERVFGEPVFCMAYSDCGEDRFFERQQRRRARRSS